MAVQWPQFERNPRGGSDAWDDGPAGVVLLSDWFPPPGPASQTLTQSARLDNSQSFFAAAVTAGAVTLTHATRFDNSQTFYSATLSQGAVDQPLTQAARFDNAQTFFAATLTPGAVTLQPSPLTNNQTFFAPVVTPGAVTLSPSLLVNESAFFGHVVSQPGGLQVLSPPYFENPNVFYPHTVGFFVEPPAPAPSPPPQDRLTNRSGAYVGAARRDEIAPQDLVSLLEDDEVGLLMMTAVLQLESATWT